MIDTRFSASHFKKHKRSGKDQSMDYQDANRAPVRVGRSAAAQEMNCTDEEAQILTRNVKPYIPREETPLWKIWKGMRWVGWALLINPAAGILFGTIGYFLFGVLFAINEGRMHFYAGYTFNTFPAFVISTILLWYSLKSETESPMVWMIISYPIFLLTSASIYVISIVTLPSLVLIGLAVFFGPSGGAFGLIGLLGLMLPLGYLWMLRQAEWWGE